MVLLTCEHLKKSYTEKTLIADVSMNIHDTDKIGFVGVNGTGKSTLLKIAAGVLEPEEGSIVRSNRLTAGYLPQNPPFEKEMTILQQAVEYSGGVEEYRCRTMLNKLGIDQYESPMFVLSGGQKKRVAVAGLLARDTNLLILDEPTNHMDSRTIEWMEQYLQSYKGAVFMITHDRYFLDRVTNRIVELEQGKLVSYEGNYDYYLEAKTTREEMALAAERKRMAIYKKELAWIRRGAQARTTKAKGRIQRFRELEAAGTVTDRASLEIDTASSRLGRKIIEIRNITKKYGNRTLIRNFSYTLLKRDRIGIIGPNGCGKSTLLNLITGRTAPDEGRIEIGETVKIGYFSQENEALDQGKRIIKYITEIAGSIQTQSGTVSASQMLERFLFPPHMHSVEIGRLSGGEKRRLYLLSILIQAPNVLILDEPANDLDIDTLTVLEDYLDDFPGAVVTVSHDRYFLDRLTVRTFAFEEDGHIGHYAGGYSDWLNRQESDKEPESVRKEKVKQDHRNRKKKLKFSYMEAKEYETIEEDITKLEEEIVQVEKAMEDSASDFVKLEKLAGEKEELDNRLLVKMERWEYLSELAQRIERGELANEN